MTRQDYYLLAIASLLHDIGKFTNKPGGGKHFLNGHEFLEKHGIVKVISEKLKVDKDIFSELILNHHVKYSELEKIQPLVKRTMLHILKIADSCSSSEREEMTPELKISTAETSGKKFASAGYAPLDCIFSNIRFDRSLGEDSKPTKYYAPGVLDVFSQPNNLFPIESDLPLNGDHAVKATIETTYNEMHDQFLNGLKKLIESIPSPNNHQAIDDNFNRLHVGLVELLQKYTWAVPSEAGKDKPDFPRDVSLYDHLRTTSAIACCLYLYFSHENNKAFIHEEASTTMINDKTIEKWLLIGADLSGIQSYLYDVTHIGPGGAAKRLRARSFYLSILMDVVSHRMLHELVPEFSLPITCRIITAGGRFIILAPKLPIVETNIKKISEQINKWMYHTFQGDLFVNIATVSLSNNDFLVQRKDQASRITSKITELNDLLEQLKTNSFRSSIVTENGWVDTFRLDHWHYDSSLGACRSCQKLPATNEFEEKICHQCSIDRKLGQHLIDSKFIAYYKGQMTSGQDPGGYVMLFFDDSVYSVQVLQEWNDAKTFLSPYLGEQISSAAYPTGEPVITRLIANYVPAFFELQNVFDFFKNLDVEQSGIPSHPLYRQLNSEGLDVLDPTKLPQIIPFDWLGAAATGSSYLGVIKSDVDRLGLIFSEGLGEMTSLSRIATLSRMTDLFFAGWTSNLLQTKFPLCYTVYAGGDDLLLVGPWDMVIELSRELSKDFRRYTSDNDDITISSGIAVTRPKFPIAKSAKRANEFLGEAKKERNRVHVFQTTVPWTELSVRQSNENRHNSIVTFDTLNSWEKIFSRGLETDDEAMKLTSGFLFRMLRYSGMCRKWQETKSMEFLNYLSHVAYDIGRNVTDDNFKQQLAKAFLGLENENLVAQLRLPITWALLKHRT